MTYYSRLKGLLMKTFSKSERINLTWKFGNGHYDNRLSLLNVWNKIFDNIGGQGIVEFYLKVIVNKIVETVVFSIMHVFKMLWCHQMVKAVLRQYLDMIWVSVKFKSTEYSGGGCKSGIFAG